MCTWPIRVHCCLHVYIYSCVPSPFESIAVYMWTYYTCVPGPIDPIAVYMCTYRCVPGPSESVAGLEALDEAHQLPGLNLICNKQQAKNAVTFELMKNLYLLKAFVHRLCLENSYSQKKTYFEYCINEVSLLPVCWSVGPSVVGCCVCRPKGLRG